MSEQKTRSHSHEIEINAPVEAVWNAITDPAGLTAWYVEEAKVDLKVGGDYWVSWGHGQHGSGTVEVVEPNARLRLAHSPMDLDETEASCAGPIKTQPEKPILEEYVLESNGTTTTLRLVTSGIPASEDWDQFYDGTNVGWAQFFRQLRHYCEHHVGAARTALTIMRPVPADAWARILGPEGLCAQGSLDGKQTGDAYAVTTAFGDELSGVVTAVKAPDVIELTIKEYEQAYLSIGFMAGAGNFLWLSLGTFGRPEAETKELHARWQAWVEALLPEPAPAS